MATESGAKADPIDEQKLTKLVETSLVDLGATVHASLAIIGDDLGLYAALDEAGPLTSAELAEQTDTAERYVREWLRAQAAGGYVTYDPETDRYGLSPEQAHILANKESPVFMPGAFQLVASAAKIEPELREAFRTGEGIGWHEHDEDVFHGTERFFGPSYGANLVSWIEALNGIDETLKAGGRVADVGCGHGAPTIRIAEAYPDSTVIGIDYHESSIAVARERAETAGVGDRVDFEVATAREYRGIDYDLVTMFNCFHDMGDPVGVSTHVRETLADDGAWMIVEPYAKDRVEDNLTPFGRLAYSISTVACTPNSLSQEVGYGLGAQAGEEQTREVATAGGFTCFRRAAETPTSLVFEARP
ncbi:methyltransferase domain-containing protein [Halogeometricum sp. S1BR25-6]|uniref:Methyltransferase domain-containing protein n=1 Tax=Halogeometricum salsisoli TaxID=2950536 RepID=A0ABU2GLU2_9EURY|nr:class I SAM-dependent methyltransferase [Halogeometricum sp. S1BR25-6]MDS0301028.1 methyltransferase domain-containing protein [Halogeometricum sp. S1BR25-6]